MTAVLYPLACYMRAVSITGWLLWLPVPIAQKAMGL